MLQMKTTQGPGTLKALDNSKLVIKAVSGNLGQLYKIHIVGIAFMKELN